MIAEEALAERRARLAVVGVIAFGVLLRLATVRAAGFPTDVGTFQAWAERLAQIGPGRFYEPGYFSDYPPAFLYVLWGFGALFDGELLRLAVKAVSIPADIGIAVLAASLVWRTAGRGAGIAAAAMWSLQPAPIFAGPYWGQVDAVGALPLLAAIVAAGRGRWALAGVLGAIAALVKPQFSIGLFIVLVAAAIDFVRGARWRPAVAAGGSAAATVYLLGIAFWGPDPARIAGQLLGLVRAASETYPYTSLYAFNVWSVFFDFWTPDQSFVVWGGVLLGVGLFVAVLPLWWRRDMAALLACAALAALAFYFLPTRAHERYLFPFFTLALPFAASRTRVLAPYALLALTFAVTLYFAFTRYQQFVDLRVPQIIESTLFGRTGQIGIALLMIGAAAYVVWRLVRGDARLAADAVWELRAPTAGRWTLPAGLGPGRLPSRRDVAVAMLVAVTVLATRGFRLDWPREMYFDEVYHARTAFELLAERDPYEWTHPHLAKEVMALAILAFAEDRVVAREDAPGGALGFVVTNDGRRAYAFADRVEVRPRDGPFRPVPLDPSAGRPVGMAQVGDEIVVVTDGALTRIDRELRVTTVRRTDGTQATAVAGAGTRLALGGPRTLAIYPALDAQPLVVSQPVVTLTAKPDGTDIYVLDPQGIVRVIAAETGLESRQLTGGQAGRAIAYAQGANRLFVARASEPVLDVFELETGAHDSVRLENGRVGRLASPATALVMVPRTDFAYALADGRAIVIETHGTSPYVSIPVSGTMLGVDGEGDTLVVAGERGAEIIETGRHAIAWRLPGVAFAAALAFFLVLLARRLFASAVLPAVVGLAVVLDGSMFAQARIGMNDIYVATLLVAGWYFVVAAHRPRRSAIVDLVIAGALFGLAAAAKWAAFYALAALLVATVAVTARAYERGRPGSGGPLDLLGRSGLNAAILFASFALLPAAIYLGSYLRWFGGPTIPYGWSLVELTQQMYWYHSSLTAPHPAGSPWWSWPLVLKPVYWYFGQSTGGDNAYIYDAGNVVLFWSALVAFFWCAVAAVRSRSVALGFIVFAALAQYVAWVPIGRVLFFYHFFTALPFYLLALAAALAYWWETGRAARTVTVLAAATAAFAYFYPFISAQPFPGANAGMFFILPTWTYDCQFYPAFVCNPQIGSSFSFTALFGRILLAAAVAVGVALLVLGTRTPTFARLVANGRAGMRR